MKGYGVSTGMTRAEDRRAPCLELPEAFHPSSDSDETLCPAGLSSSHLWDGVAASLRTASPV